MPGPLELTVEAALITLATILLNRLMYVFARRIRFYWDLMELLGPELTWLALSLAIVLLQSRECRATAEFHITQTLNHATVWEALPTLAPACVVLWTLAWAFEMGAWDLQPKCEHDLAQGSPELGTRVGIFALRVLSVTAGGALVALAAFLFLP